jgi:hypothetical protein
MISRAADIQADNPDLSRLPLLRAAMDCLPKNRRRLLNAITHAPWFEPGVAAEIHRRANETNAKADLAPILKGTAATSAELASLHSVWHAEHVAWHGDLVESQRSIVAALVLVLDELRALNVKLGQPPQSYVAVPVPLDALPVKPRLRLNEPDEEESGRSRGKPRKGSGGGTGTGTPAN